MDEDLSGWVVDIACSRKYPTDGILDKAKRHTRGCLLMGHCVESGYGLVTASSEVRLLDTSATAKIVSLLQSDCAREQEIQLKVLRSSDEDGEMQTRDVQLVT